MDDVTDIFLFLYYIKPEAYSPEACKFPLHVQNRFFLSMLLCVCLVIDHRRRHFKKD